MTVERFKVIEGHSGFDLHPDDEGDLVEYTDYQKLVAENATLVAENKIYYEATDGFINKMQILKSAVKTAICWFDNYASMDYGSHDVKRILQEAFYF